MSEDILKPESFEEDTQYGKYLTFHLDKEVFGLEIRYVIEIIGVQLITKISEEQPHIKGIINLRGIIIPVIDVRLLFGKEPIDYTDRTCIIVVKINSVSIGLIVDGVEEVLIIKDEEISIPPTNKTGFQNRYIKGIGKANEKIQLLLECRRLLKDDDVETVEELFNKVS